IPWSPLASGVLAGKYTKADLAIGAGSPDPGSSRKNVAAANGMLHARALDIAAVVKSVAAELGKTPSQVAIAWTLTNPAVTAPILGECTLAQLEATLGALDDTIPRQHLDQLERASAIERGFPHDFMEQPMVQQLTRAGAAIT